MRPSTDPSSRDRPRGAERGRHRPRRHRIRPARLLRIRHRDPHIDALARGGLRYNRFHVTSLCSPTRAAFLTGRNHHAVGMGFLADIPLGYPGYTARIPKSAAPMPRVLRDNGYATMAVGKWHLVPRWQRSFAGPFDSWPLGLGFEHYYGFLQGDTNHWSPNLVADNHYVDPPRRPEDGYHLTEDLADVAIRNVKDHHHAAPGKPFFLYFALGAMHAPTTSPPSGWHPTEEHSTMAGMPGAHAASPASSNRESSLRGRR